MVQNLRISTNHSHWCGALELTYFPNLKLFNTHWWWWQWFSHSMAHSFIEFCKPLCHDKTVIHEGEPLYLNNYNQNNEILLFSVLQIPFSLVTFRVCEDITKMAFISCIWFKFLEDNFAKLQVFDSLISLHGINH